MPDVFTPGDGKFWSVTNMNGGEISADGQFSGGQPGTYPQLIALTYIHGGAGIHRTVYADVVVTE